MSKDGPNQDLDKLGVLLEQRQRRLDELIGQGQRRIDKMMSDLNGGDPAQKQLMLLKLVDLMENRPDFSGTGIIAADSPQRKWLATAGALLKRLDSIFLGTKFDTSMGMMGQYRAHAVNQIQGYLADAIESTKLELELDGSDEIGTAYAPGDVYSYFADLKKIVAGATTEVFVIDPYFDGAAFDAYFSDTTKGIAIRVLAERYAKDIPAYARKHAAQYGTAIEVRRSDELHDRLVFIDGADCWLTGGSIKDAGKKAAYLIPAAPAIAEAKKKIYGETWGRAKPLA